MTAPCPALGFRVVLESGAELDDAGHDIFLDAWIDFLENRGLYCGGGGRNRMEFVVASEASQATENDRVAARTWLASRAELRAWHVGDLEDLNREDQ
jgi:uncharacterized protein YggL (DUF469 family)